MSCVGHCADCCPVTSIERQEPIQKCFRALEFIAKFIIHSRQLFARATQGMLLSISSLLDNAPNKVRYPKETPLISGQNEDGFRMDVHMVFNSFNKMLSVCYDSIVPAQTLFLEHISSVYPHFLQALPTLDLAKLITLMFDSVSKDTKLMHPKLTAILHAVKSPIFQGIVFLCSLTNFKVIDYGQKM